MEMELPYRKYTFPAVIRMWAPQDIHSGRSPISSMVDTWSDGDAGKMYRKFRLGDGIVSDHLWSRFG